MFTVRRQKDNNNHDDVLLFVWAWMYGLSGMTMRDKKARQAILLFLVVPESPESGVHDDEKIKAMENESQ